MNATFRGQRSAGWLVVVFSAFGSSLFLVKRGLAQLVPRPDSVL